MKFTTPLALLLATASAADAKKDDKFEAFLNENWNKYATDAGIDKDSFMRGYLAANVKEEDMKNMNEEDWKKANEYLTLLFDMGDENKSKFLEREDSPSRNTRKQSKWLWSIWTKKRVVLVAKEW